MPEKKEGITLPGLQKLPFVDSGDMRGAPEWGPSYIGLDSPLGLLIYCFSSRAEFGQRRPSAGLLLTSKLADREGKNV